MLLNYKRKKERHNMDEDSLKNSGKSCFEKKVSTRSASLLFNVKRSTIYKAELKTST